eukprot:COSAG02_NODE_4530_length_5252_cov_5.919658_10_plen_76_part_01
MPQAAPAAYYRLFVNRSADDSTQNTHITRPREALLRSAGGNKLIFITLNSYSKPHYFMHIKYEIVVTARRREQRGG